MGLKSLINNQYLTIDDHKQGAGEIKNWDDPSIDIHIHKETKRSINGRKQKVIIKAPINKDQQISVVDASGKSNDVPRSLKREIIKALSDVRTRQRFINEVLDIIKNFDTILTIRERAHETLERISKHFDLEWTKESISTYVENVQTSYIEKYKDEYNKTFYLGINRQYITLGDFDNYNEILLKLLSQ